MKPRIHILGGPGSGKSYVASILAKKFGIPAYDLDNLYWVQQSRGYGLRAEAAQRDRQLAGLVAQSGWIVEGVYYQWLAPSFDRANVIIALTPALWIRQGRVIRAVSDLALALNR